MGGCLRCYIFTGNNERKKGNKKILHVRASGIALLTCCVTQPTFASSICVREPCWTLCHRRSASLLKDIRGGPTFFYENRQLVEVLNQQSVCRVIHSFKNKNNCPFKQKNCWHRKAEMCFFIFCNFFYFLRISQIPFDDQCWISYC